MLDFSRKKSINQSKSHARDRKAESGILPMYKYGINFCLNFSMSLQYFKSTQINELHIIGNLLYWNEIPSPYILQKLLQDLPKPNSE